MAEIWKYYLRLGPIRIPLGSRIVCSGSDLNIEKPEFKPIRRTCSHNSRYGLKKGSAHSRR